MSEAAVYPADHRAVDATFSYTLGVCYVRSEPLRLWNPGIERAATERASRRMCFINQTGESPESLRFRHPPPHHAFLRHARDQPPCAIEDPAAIVSPSATAPRAVGGV